MPWDWMPMPLAVLWVIWVLQAAWCCWNVRSLRLRIHRLDRRRDRRAAKEASFTPPAAIIIPAKGAPPGLHEHVQAIRGQDYPRYRTLFVVESESDPAYPALAALIASAESGGPPMELRIAGPAERGGQKVHNQLAGIEATNEADDVIVFADIDAVPDDQWLRHLVDRLSKEQIAATTGYRWMIPASDDAAGLPTRLACILNASVASLLGPPWRNHAWGGSMAIRRTTLHEIRLLDRWRGALSDDYQLTRAARLAGKRVFFEPRCLVPSSVRFTWRSLLEFGRRQYLITRIHAPLIWCAALLATGGYTAGWIGAIVAAALQWPGWGWGLCAWAAAFAFDLLRTRERRRLVAEVFDESIQARLGSVFGLERWTAPLWMAVHFAIVLSSAVGRTITWAGVTYELRGPQDVRIERRMADGPSPAIITPPPNPR